MKKIFVLLLAVVFIASCSVVAAKNRVNSELASAIKMYKEGNFSECYSLLEDYLKEDTSNALAYYYMAITSAQIGKKEEAVLNYERVLFLSPQNNNLNRYAKKGKLCIEAPEKCNESSYGSLLDEFIQKKQGERFSEEVKSDYEKLKLENFMREMNRDEHLEKNRFEDFKDFSSSTYPSDEEIVAALRVLQKAGFSDIFTKKNNYADIAAFTGNAQHNSMSDVFGGSATMNPQLLQMLLTNGITQGF